MDVRSLVALALATVANAVACFAPTIRDGELACLPGGDCPPGFNCELDGRCWRNGAMPAGAAAGTPCTSGDACLSGVCALGSCADAAAPLAAPCTLECVHPSVCLGEACDAATIVAAHAGSELSIDGEAAEPVWAEAVPVTFRDRGGVSSNVATMRSAWSATSLYVLFEVHDAELEVSTEPCVCADDGLEVYLDTLNDRTASMQSDDYQVLISVEDESYVRHADHIPVDLETEWQFAFPTGGWRCELRMSFAAMGVTPVADLLLGLNLVQNDRENGSYRQYDWVGVGTAFSQPNLWGQLRLAPP